MTRLQTLLGHAALVVTLSFCSACSGSGPEAVPLTAGRLASAEAQWKAAQPDAYDLTVRFKVARLEPVVYDVVVRGGSVVTAKRNGRTTTPAQARDYTVLGLFELLRSELRLTEPDANGMPAARAELFVRFDARTGRLERFRRSTTRRATGLGVEVLAYTPHSGHAVALANPTETLAR